MKVAGMYEVTYSKVLSRSPILFAVEFVSAGLYGTILCGYLFSRKLLFVRCFCRKIYIGGLYFAVRSLRTALDTEGRVCRWIL